MGFANMKLHTDFDNPLLDDDDDDDETYTPPAEHSQPVSALVAPSSPKEEQGLDGVFSEYIGEDHDEEKDAKRGTHNPIDDRLGNLSGTPKATSNKKKTTKKYRRRFITPNDLKLLTFLALFKMSNSTQLAHLLDVKTNTAHKRLLGLQEAKIVGSNKDILGAKMPWYVTGNGLKTLETVDEFDLDLARRMRETDLETSEIGHYLAVNQVAIQLLIGQNPLVIDGWDREVSVEDFITEYQVDSAWGEWRERSRTEHFQLATAARAWRNSFIGGSSDGPRDPSPNVQYVVLTDRRSEGSKQYHLPDLVLRGEDRIKHIAIEVETSVKATSEYKRIIAMYLKDERHISMSDAQLSGYSDADLRSLEEAKLANRRIYDRLVWVCNSTQAMTRINKAAEELDLLDESFCKVVPLFGWDGKRFTGKAWKL